ncbi:hypothetical protein KFU94_33350 [Chloroflexi bacterium TSY]|nr:hypothetical protein [Chloroflexi bacterium TSY]
MNNMPEVLQGLWTYRSFNNQPDLNIDFDKLEFGRGNLRIDEAPLQTLKGLIYGEGWQLTLTGSVNYGDPFTLRFQGKGVVNGEEWIYAYLGYFVNEWPNGVDQRPAIVGSIVRVIPHSGGDGTVHPAGVVASWYAVKQRR